MSIEELLAISRVEYDVPDYLLKTMTVTEKWGHVIALNCSGKQLTSLPSLPDSLESWNVAITN